MKDADGFWVGDYWGVIAFGINASLVHTTPKSWADLKDSGLQGRVAMNGDPRTSGSAFAGVFSAALANGGSLDNIMPGIQYFADLKKSGNFITVDATPATVANGQTPVTIDWDYLQLSYGIEFKGKLDWKVSVPSSGVFGNYYCQAISAFSKHPYAARLWQEFCYSDAGPAALAQGVHAPGPVPGPGQAREDPGEPPVQAAAGPELQERQVPERGPDRQGQGRGAGQLAADGARLSRCRWLRARQRSTPR